jgi:hypothetical protein
MPVLVVAYDPKGEGMLRHRHFDSMADFRKKAKEGGYDDAELIQAFEVSGTVKDIVDLGLDDFEVDRD